MIDISLQRGVNKACDVFEGIRTSIGFDCCFKFHEMQEESVEAN